MRARGFTLIEIMVVVVIIGLLATLVTPYIFSVGEEGKRKLAKAKCVKYHGAVKLWHTLKNRYPHSLEDLEQPLSPGQDDFERIDEDPWGNPSTTCPRSTSARAAPTV